MKQKLLITGGASFIGSEFARQVVKSGYRPIIIDKLTYAGDLARLAEVKANLKFYKQDICDSKAIEKIFREEKPSQVVHFAAESHVDRSILGSDEFIRTNICGTQVLLDCAKKQGIERFVHISTDEVYGDIIKGQFYEDTPLNPSSPYSASKASADLLVKSYMRTFKFPAIIIRPSNNYGPWQYPEKFIPVIIYKALKNEKIPVYAKGLNVREWLFVSDCSQAVLAILKKGVIGEIYNVGSGQEKRNIDVVKAMLQLLKKPASLIEFVQDRPGHDLRYSLNCAKIKKDLHWQAHTSFENGIRRTVDWYKDNFDWLETRVKYLLSYWQKVYKYNHFY